MQNDVKLFALLYIATQARVRGGDMDKLFKHETRTSPPAQSKMEKSDPETIQTSVKLHAHNNL